MNDGMKFWRIFSCDFTHIQENGGRIEFNSQSNGFIREFERQCEKPTEIVERSEEEGGRERGGREGGGGRERRRKREEGDREVGREEQRDSENEREEKGEKGECFFITVNNFAHCSRKQLHLRRN